MRFTSMIERNTISQFLGFLYVPEMEDNELVLVVLSMLFSSSELVCESHSEMGKQFLIL